jgi:predicted 3-demethylubiquinone-9 3-methyltransferase (glyoxalase superfamily)
VKAFASVTRLGQFSRLQKEHGMMSVTQHLWFEKDMEAAIRFYTSLIPGSAIIWTSAIPADNPSGPAGSVKIAAFTLGDQRYMAAEPGPLDPFNHSFSIVVGCEDQPGIDRLWDALKEGGSVERCGWLKNRWGLCWQIVPKRLGELMNDPDAAKAKRVAEAMLKMVKFDIAELEAAASRSS